MKKLLLGIIVMLGFNGLANAQAYRFQAMYIYNFSRMIEWPEEYKNGYFDIGVIGNENLLLELKNFTTNKKAGNQSISIVDFNSLADINKCHILFVGGDMAKNFTEIFSKVKGYSTLIISEEPNLLNEGAAISFVIVDGKLKYHLNTENAQKKGLKVSSLLEKMSLADK